MSKKEEFSEQVILEYEENPDDTLLECLERIRSTHGYEPENVKKYLTNNLISMLEVESSKKRLIEKSSTTSLGSIFK